MFLLSDLQLPLSLPYVCDTGEGVYTIWCSNYEKKYIGEINRRLKNRVKEHREEVDKLMEGRSFIRGARKESETDQWNISHHGPCY